MRLLDTSNYTRHEFHDENIPKYAILSHRWEEEDEISSQELQSDKPEFRKKKGWAKVRNFCNHASSAFELEYAWVDTCCIDKTSSAELQEVINSMLRWYRDAFRCVFYLCDVQSGSDDENQQSSWVTREWTLQDLLVPYPSVFLGRRLEDISRLSA